MSQHDNSQILKNCTLNAFLGLLMQCFNMILAKKIDPWNENKIYWRYSSVILMMISWHDLSKIMLGHYVWGQFLSDQSLNAFKNQLNIFILCIYSIIQPKKTWKREKIQFFANDIMLGHLPFKWLLETGEAKTCKLDQYV